MASDACLECGHEIPDKGKVCPRCGAKVPLGQRTMFAFWGTILVGLFSAYLTFGSELPLKFESDEADASAASLLQGEGQGLSSDLGPGSSFASLHPDFLAHVAALIRSRGQKCPAIANLWNNGDPASGARFEALCGPDKDHVDASFHYVVDFRLNKVNRCQPWKVFGPDCA